MIKKILLPVVASLVSATSFAQLQEGQKNIDKLCGCFNIDFMYAETFSPDTSYKFHGREILKGLEVALPIERTDKKIVIQHLLVINDSIVVKHWREDWEFESPYLWKFEGGKEWTKQALKPEQYKGKWTQSVWEVDDAPRYQGISEWVNTDGKTFWQSTTDAPLPRREYTNRNDYNILRRGNRLVLTPTGWTHEQDNDKVVKKDGKELLIAQEKGYNVYHRESDKACASAVKWWKDNQAFWTLVRGEWDKLAQAKHNLILKATVDGKRLSRHFELLSESWQKKELKTDAITAQVRVVLEKFTQGDTSTTASRNE